MKKYRIRKLSPLWWVTRVGGITLMVASCYVIMCCAAACEV